MKRPALEHKARYLTLLERVEPRMVAGVPVRKPPLRAWAMAPLSRAVCDVFRADGAAGVVPMVPGAEQAPLRAFVADIVRGCAALATDPTRPLAAR